MNEVWIVDDDRSIRGVLEKVLTKAGFTCRSFSDGNAAWTALQNDCPGVLISDIRMPGPMASIFSRASRKSIRSFP